MYVRRNYRDPFFREKSKTPAILRRFLFVLLIILGIGAFAFFQQDKVLEIANDYLGPEVTPTPLPGELAGQAQDLFWDGELENSLLVWQRAIAMRPDNID